jgi:hypothetical protein
MWLLTSVLDRRRLGHKQLVRYYKMRWGIEVEFRGLKQTIDKQTLRCRNANRLLVELDWSVRMMAVTELLALRERISAAAARKREADTYDPQDRSLANTLRALRKCMRNLHKYSTIDDGLLHDLSQARVQRYQNRTDKRARYRPKNPDKKTLGEPNIHKLTRSNERNSHTTTLPPHKNASQCCPSEQPMVSTGANPWTKGFPVFFQSYLDKFHLFSMMNPYVKMGS